MSRPALSATVTHRVRAFLASQGIQVEPWSSLEETYDRLYQLLRNRREDPEFWPALRALIAAIVQAAAEPGRLPTRDAEVLCSWDLDHLLGELRSALPERGEARAWREFTRPLSAPVLGAFLLLGWVAVGCGGNVDTTIPVAPKDASVDLSVVDAKADQSLVDVKKDQGAGLDAVQEDTGWVTNCPLDKGSVLFQTLANSQLSEPHKDSLCNCFTNLNASWNQGLTELFATGTAEQVAHELDLIMQCCQWEPNQLNSDFPAVRVAFLNGTLCSIPKPYRGVTLPER